MHSIMRDHDQATCRILSLTMLVDGWVGQEERSALLHTGIIEKLGLDLDVFEAVFESFLAETSSSACDEPCIRARISSERINDLLGRIHDPATQALLLDAMSEIVKADGLLTREETALLDQARAYWPDARLTLM